MSLSRLDNAIGFVLRAVPTLCLAALFVLLLVNVVARTFGLAGFAWFDEVVQGLFAWMVFFGAAALWRERSHFAVDWLPLALPPTPARIVRIAATLISLAFLAIMTVYGLRLTMRASALTPILDLPTALFYAAIPMSGAVMCAFSTADLVRLIRADRVRHTSRNAQ